MHPLCEDEGPSHVSAWEESLSCRHTFNTCLILGRFRYLLRIPFAPAVAFPPFSSCCEPRPHVCSDNHLFKTTQTLLAHYCISQTAIATPAHSIAPFLAFPFRLSTYKYVAHRPSHPPPSHNPRHVASASSFEMPKLDDLWYTRPKGERTPSIHSNNSSQISGRSSSSAGIPDGLQLQLVLNGQTCPPCSVRDFNVRRPSEVPIAYPFLIATRNILTMSSTLPKISPFTCGSKVLPK